MGLTNVLVAFVLCSVAVFMTVSVEAGGYNSACYGNWQCDNELQCTGQQGFNRGWCRCPSHIPSYRAGYRSDRVCFPSNYEQPSRNQYDSGSGYSGNGRNGFGNGRFGNGRFGNGRFGNGRWRQWFGK